MSVCVCVGMWLGELIVNVTSEPPTQATQAGRSTKKKRKAAERKVCVERGGGGIRR